MEQKISKTQQTFNEYVGELLPKMVELYGYGMSSVQTMQDWQYKMPYQESVEKFLISDARTFIRSLSYDNTAHTNPTFLNVLAWKMSDYFAIYTTLGRRDYNPNLPMNENPAYQEEVRRLHSHLFNNFNYIKNMKKRQRERREEKRNPKSPDVIARREHERIASIKIQIDLYKDINALIYSETRRPSKKKGR